MFPRHGKCFGMASSMTNAAASDIGLLERIETVQNGLDRTMDSYRDIGRIYHGCLWRARNDDELDSAVCDVLRQLYIKANPINTAPWFHHYRVAL